LDVVFFHEWGRLFSGSGGENRRLSPTTAPYPYFSIEDAMVGRCNQLIMKELYCYHGCDKIGFFARKATTRSLMDSADVEF
jgi:hypothetical protein